MSRAKWLQVWPAEPGQPMLDIAAGAVRAFYLFEVADTIDLSRLRTVSGEGLTPADLPLRPHTSSAYIAFTTPPLSALLADADFGDLRCTVRVKLFDYGVISLRLSFNAAGSWDNLRALVERIQTDPRIVSYATNLVTRVCDELADVLDDRRPPLLEDVIVVEVERFAQPVEAEALLRDESNELASLLLNERKRLSPGETAEALRIRFSYLPDDLTILQWDTAFVYDRRESADAIEDIIEFANSQLLELRAYDGRLDRELDSIYRAQMVPTAPSLRGRKEAEQAESLRYLIVDVLEVIDRSSNVLKVVGDAYYARIYRAVSNRLGIADWQKQVDAKLASLGEMYRFFIDQARGRRDEFLELIVIVLIALELVVGIATLLHPFTR